MGTGCLSVLQGGCPGLRPNWQQTKGARIPKMRMFGVSAWHSLPIPWGDTAIQYQTWEGDGVLLSRSLQATSQGDSAPFCQLWDLEGGGISSIPIDSASHGGWLLAVACWHSGPTFPEVSPQTAANSLGTGAQFEGKPSWPVPTVCPTTVKTYWVLSLITHPALTSGRL